MAAKDWEGGPKLRLYSFPSTTGFLGPQTFQSFGSQNFRNHSLCMGEQIDHDQLAMKIHLLVSSGEFHSEENPPEDAWQILEQYAADFFCVRRVYATLMTLIKD